MNAIVPIPTAPRADANVRLATLGDVPFIDSLQKKFGKQLGFQAISWIESRIAKGEVLIADGAGYIIATDKYLKREELGLVIQLCVDPAKQRGLIGAMLVKAAFERAAYGCRLFCLWCAQDIEANKFWESIGFVPLAYRAGSEKKRRIHIFWQKRIQEGDTTTPWWYPCTTNAGAMGEDRIVLPIPPGKHWSDEMPVIVRPDVEKTPAKLAGPALSKLEGPRVKQIKKSTVELTTASQRLNFTAPVPIESVKAGKKPRGKKVKVKNDPKLVAAARELRDRWMEKINTGDVCVGAMLAAKYEVSRQLSDTHSSVPLLPAA